MFVLETHVTHFHAFELLYSVGLIQQGVPSITHHTPFSSAYTSRSTDLVILMLYLGNETLHVQYSTP
jgi:hypothetical protein